VGHEALANVVVRRAEHELRSQLSDDGYRFVLERDRPRHGDDEPVFRAQQHVLIRKKSIAAMHERAHRVLLPEPGCAGRTIARPPRSTTAECRIKY
jgi:hypothetical protein